MKYPVFARAAILFVALAIGMSSCIMEYPDSNDCVDADEPATMRIFLSLDTRTYEAPGFEDGVEYENFIDIDGDNYRIYFFDTEDNTFIDEFVASQHPSLLPENVYSDDGLVFKGYLLPEIGAKFKLVVVANWSSYPEVLSADAEFRSDSFALVKGATTILDLTTHVGSQYDALETPEAGGCWLGKGRLMPFYGVRSFDLTQSHPDALDAGGKVLPGKVIDLKDYAVPLIRAMAKVEVLVDNPYASFEAVEMSRICRKGFAAPYVSVDSWKFDWSDYWAPDGGWNGNYVKGVHIVGNGGVEYPSLHFTKVTDRIENHDGSVTLEKWVAYMPEFKNSGVSNPTTIRVKLQPSVVGGSGDDSEDRQWRELCFTDNGETGDALDIERNNIYRFRVGMDAVTVDVQPFTGHSVRFEFGLLRDERGDLMVLPVPERDDNGNIILDENGNPKMTYPQYFLNFIADDNPNHKYPDEVGVDGRVIEGSKVRLEDGDYYAIVVGEDEDMSSAVVWVKDRNGCHVLSNFESEGDWECNARLVESFYGNNLSEIFHKDRQGFRRVYHFENHNSIVIHPVGNNMLFCMIDGYGTPNQKIWYYEVESWDEDSYTGWIINKDEDGNEVGFQKITSEGLLGDAVNLDGSSISN